MPDYKAKLSAELKELSSVLSTVSKSIELYINQYQKLKTASSEVVNSLKEINNEFTQLSSAVIGAGAEQNVKNFISRIDELQRKIARLKFGSEVETPLQQFSSFISASELLSKKVENISSMASVPPAVWAELKSISVKFNEEVAKNLQKQLEEIYGDVRRELLSLATSKPSSLRTFSRRKGLIIPEGFPAGAYQAISGLAKRNAILSEVEEGSFKETLDFVINTITGEVYTLEEFRKKLEQFKPAPKPVKVKEKLSPEVIVRSIEDQVNRITQLTDQQKQDVINKLVQEFKGLGEQVNVVVQAENDLVKRITARSKSKRYKYTLQLPKQELQKIETRGPFIDDKIKEMLREYAGAESIAFEYILSLANDPTIKDIKFKVDDAKKKLTAEIKRGSGKLIEKRIFDLSKDIETTAPQVPETSGFIKRQVKEGFNQLVNKFDVALAKQIDEIIKRRVGYLTESQYYTLNIPETPSFSKKYGAVYNIQALVREIGQEKPVRRVSVPVGIDEQFAIDVISAQQQENALKRHVERMKKTIEELGATEVVNNVLKRTGILLSDLADVKLVNTEKGFQKLIILANQLGDILPKRIEVLGKQVGGVFKEDVLAQIERTLLETRRETNLETARKQAQVVMGKLEEYGFDRYSTVLTSRTREPSGITFFTAKIGDAKTGIRELTLAMNKYGEVLEFTNKRMLDFFSTIAVNISSVFQWSIGATLVYGSYQKLSEILAVAVDNQTKLAHINVVLGESARSLNSIFEDGNRIAKKTGESINGVLEAYTLAYRALGAVSSQAEKTVAANELLANALTLSKLSGLSTADAIDVLSGALRQMQKEGEGTAEAFSRASDLLDSWVMITRKANVDMATLATAFSLIEEQAANVGLSLEQINAVIAALAEKAGGYSGRETGNSIRAIIGGMYTPQAVTALTRFGIATKDINGNLRNFLEISQDIYDLYSKGLITPGQLSKLSYEIGGGVRNQQRVQWFLSDLPRINQLVEAQANRTGAAQSALARITETVQTKTTLLSNAFLNLSQTLGTSGGLLDNFSAYLDILTGALDVTSKLVKVLGTLTIPVSLLLFLQLLRRNEAYNKRWLEFTGNIDTMLIGSPLLSPISNNRNYFEIAKTLSRGAVGFGLGTLAALPEITKLISDKEANQQEWWTVGATIAGGIAGALTGNPAIALLGASIAREFVGGIVKAKSTIQDVVVPEIYKKPEQVAPLQPELTTEQEKLRNLYQKYGKQLYGPTGIFRLRTIPETFTVRGMEVSGLPEERTEQSMVLFTALKIIQEYENRKYKGPPRTAEEYVFRAQYEAALKVVEEAGLFKKFEQPGTRPEDTEVTRFLNAFSEKQYGLVQKLLKSEQERIRKDLFRGVYTVGEYNRISQAMTGFTAAAAQYSVLQELPRLIPGVNKELIDAIPNIERFSTIMLSGTEEVTSEIVALQTEIVDLSTAIESASGGQVKFKDETLSTGDAVQRLNFLIEMFNNLVKQSEEAINKARYSKILELIPKTTEMTDITSIRDYERIYQRAVALQAEELEALKQTGFLTDQDIEFLLRNAEPKLVRLGKNLGYMIAKGLIDSKFLTQAFQELEKSGEVNVNLGYQFLGVTLSQFKAIEAQYQAIRNAILQKQGTSEETPLLTFFKDSNNPLLFRKDWKIVQYLLGQILETEKKQLDGIYNLPSEATAWVPFQSLQYAYQKGLNEAGMGGGTADFSELNQASEQAGGKLSELGITAGQAADGLRYLAQYLKYQESSKLTKSQQAEANRWQAMYEYYIQHAPKFPQKDDLGPSYSIQPPPTTKLFDFGTLWEDIVRDFNEWKTRLQNLFTQPLFNPPNIDTAKRKDMDLILPTTQQIPQVSTNLRLDIKSSTQLIVDGRTLATVVKNYIWEDLVKYVNSSTAVTQSYTII